MRKIKCYSYNIILYNLFIIIFIASLIFSQQKECDIKGKRLYETNLELRKNLLDIHNNNYKRTYNFIITKFSWLKENSHNNSIEELDAQKHIILDSIKCNKLIVHLTKNQVDDRTKYERELNIYKKRYFVEYYSEEAFYYHHGLRFASNRLKNYINYKDIIDVGACIGDSLIVLQNYTKKIVHLYEISKRNIIKLRSNIKRNKINNDKYIIHEKGLSNFTGTIVIADKGSGGVGIGKYKGNSIAVNVTTLDSEFSNCNCSIGFIKVDIEGQGYNFILGAINTIHKHRPVISASIYHNYNEYFLTRRVLESALQNYIYEYHQFNNCEPWACDFSIFAYPSEIN